MRDRGWLRGWIGVFFASKHGHRWFGDRRHDIGDRNHEHIYIYIYNDEHEHIDEHIDNHECRPANDLRNLEHQGNP